MTFAYSPGFPFPFLRSKKSVVRHLFAYWLFFSSWKKKKGIADETMQVALEENDLPSETQAMIMDLYRTHFKVLFRMAAGLLGNREDAADTVQDVFASLLQKSLAMKSKADFLSYAMTSVRNRCIDKLRAASTQKRVQEYLADNSDETGTAETAFSAKSDLFATNAIIILKSALDQLKGRDKTILTLHFFESRTNEEIAQMLGVTQQHLNAIKSRALSRLRKLVEKQNIQASLFI